jgi:hypothetical protein
MHSWLRKELAWLVLAATFLSLPGPVSKACACARMSADAGCSQMDKKDCSRHVSAAATSTARITRRSCCQSKVVEAHVATTPAKITIERHEQRVAAPAAVAPSPAARATAPSRSRPPPGRARESASPPASYLSDYLRL